MIQKSTVCLGDKIKNGLSVVCLLILGGCDGGVREDRTIEFSADGDRVAFQHDQDGVYVANSNGVGLTKIFQPEENVLATSRPLACPTDGRLIFATARSLQDDAQGAQTGRHNELGPYPAEGKLVWQQPVRYTCWLGSEAETGNPPSVKKVFEAKCGHVGTVSAGLAVRWHPDGKSILYCAAIDERLDLHSIFEFDLATEKSKRVFPGSARAILFDWSPVGSHLVCVMTDGQMEGKTQNLAPAANNRNVGIWIGAPEDEKSWWHVSGSEQLAGRESLSEIEMLRASRPIWTRDETLFSFVSQTTSNEDQPKIHSVLHQVDLATRTTRDLHAVSGTFSDLHWSPDGKNLGFLQRTDDQSSSLNILDNEFQIATVPSEGAVRKFAGFDSTGKKICYVTGVRNEQLEDSKCLALLLRPSPMRDSVRIAFADASEAGDEVFSGMQVTFPRWSPTEETLSMWLTFVPRYQSLLSIYARMGLWPGDPAATIDLKTNSIAWMAVSPEEELQIGHYHLLKGDAKEAWRWYEQARKKMPEPHPPTNSQEFVQRLGAPENSQLFEFLCLVRLGRNSDATEKWREFEENFYPVIKPEDKSSAIDFANFLGSQSALGKPFLRDLVIAETFLSVDGFKEALEHFSNRQIETLSDAEVLSRFLILGQLMLIARDHSGYLKHSTDVVAPLAMKVLQADLLMTSTRDSMVPLAIGMSLAPLFRADFFEQLPSEIAQETIEKWSELSPDQNSGLPAVAINLVLRAAANRLENAETRKLAEERLAVNTDAQPLFNGKPIDDAIESWFHGVGGK
jgi:hypothetical protein